MKRLFILPQKYILPAVALAIGLIIGLGIGNYHLKKEQQVSQDRLKEANKKIAYIQKKLAEEKNETVASVEQRCQSDLEKLRNEKKALGAQIAKFKEQTPKLEQKIKETEELQARTKKELQEMVKNNKDLDRDLKKTAGEKQTVQADLKKTTKELGQCVSNNAALSIMAEELVDRYKNKGLGAALMQNEPLTQIKKVELEQLTKKYQEEIEQQKIKSKDGGKHVID